MIEDWGSWFLYDSTSPTFLRNKVDRLGGKDFKSPVAVTGEVAGCTGTDGYAVVGLNNKPYKVHNVIWEMFNGAITAGFVVDHEDGNQTNNDIHNLRLVENAVNQRNKKLPSTNTSGIVGVRLFETEKRGKWYRYWRAFWVDFETKKYRSRDFSIAKLGNDIAFTLACKCRSDAISAMNSKGAGYSGRHGT